MISSNYATSPFPVYPLGLSIIAKSLEDAGYSVKQFDFLQNDKSIIKFRAELDEFKPDIVGISIRNIDNINLLNKQSYIETVCDIVNNVHNSSTAKVVLGGSGFSLMPDVILKHVKADYGIVGEGETLFLEFINNAANNIYPDKKCIVSSNILTGKDILPASYDTSIMKYYLKSGSIAPIQTKRGCPHHCIYCSYPLLEGHHLRCRPAQQVVDDIVKLKNEFGAKFIFFTDSVFNDDEGHYLDVINEMHKRRVAIPCTAFFKPGNIKAESICLMKETGLSAVEIGADGSTDYSLKKLGKIFSFKDVIRTNLLFNSFDIPTANYYIFGVPGETNDIVLQGVDNILSLEKTVSFIYMGIRILPDTGLHKLAVNQNYISDSNLLEPVYYISPSLDKNWLESTLTDKFKENRNCIFPPDSMKNQSIILHSMGQTGILWDLLLKKRRKRRVR
ncbi:MAG TPA: lipid biosynthesis B12-binding/radical SAM protein [Victivallales bacterium]|nr:lipid biosynthesis B12-binding/radical SAM protein [Victivallales bacterium]